MIDKKFRLFGKLSVMDILIVAIVAVISYVGVQFSAPVSVEAAPSDTRIIYTVELTNKRSDFINNVHIGDTLFDSIRGFEIGRIISVDSRPFYADAPCFDTNIIRRGEVEGFSFIYIEVEANAQISERATSVGNFDVMVGMEVFVRTRDFASAGFVVRLERAND
ncbi:MAG: DUF4330 domain-containing protein [Defluviitaleaceae bacterium]|nr:DUF4330 domain-containing protein [Defluviitaleaceae bacterium]